MSDDEATRQKAQNDYRNSQYTENMRPHQGNAQQVQTYNSELERQRREQEDRNRNK